MTTSPTRPARDGFLDALRAIALGRVIVWHALGVPIISWFITTMPLMFFVAGSLLHGSLERRPAPLVLRRRLKRLLVPYWLFGAITLGFLSFVHLRVGSADTALRAKQLLWWIVPLRDPSASGWEAGWASSPLWYLRAYLWILLLSPLLLKAWRRLGLVTLIAPVVVMVLAQRAASNANAGPGDLIWVIGDLGIYGFFVLLGFAHNSGRLAPLRRRDYGEWALIFAATTAVAWRLAPSTDGVVNHSYIALWSLGIAWICAFMMLRPWMSKALDTPFIGSVVYWTSRRAMSVYLWHSPSIVGSYWLLNRVGQSAEPLPVLTLTVGLVMVASLLTGWIEDVAGGKSPELWPRRGDSTFSIRYVIARLCSRSAAVRLATFSAGAAISLIASAVFIPADATFTSATASGERSAVALALPPAPSGRPDPQAGTSAAPDETATSEAAGDIASLLDGWRSQNDVDGVRIFSSTGASSPSSIVVGSQPDGTAMHADDTFPVTSITKTMTAAIILQLVDEGVIDLDTAPRLAAVPDFNLDGAITVRQLLDHSSGLVPYQQARGYLANQPLTAIEAVTMSSRTPLEWTPGAAGGYSNSGYLALGLLIEELTGTTYEQALRKRIIEPLNLSSTRLDEGPAQGWVGAAAGGVVSSMHDLHRWGDALYRSNQVLSPARLADMIAVDPSLSSGLGAFPVCPCQPAQDGTLDYTSIGHNGGSVTMQYAPASDSLIIASLSESFWTTELTQQHIYGLLTELRSTMSATETMSGP